MASGDIRQFLHSNNPLPNIVQQAGTDAETQTMDYEGLERLIAEMGSPQAVFQRFYGNDPRGWTLSPDEQSVNYQNYDSGNDFLDWA